MGAHSNPATAADIRPGDLVTYTPAPGRTLPRPSTLYVRDVANTTDGDTEMSGAAFTRSTWPYLHRDTLPADHPVTIYRPTWATTGANLLVHVIDPDGDHTTLCRSRGARPLAADQMPRYAVCRTCGYRVVKTAAARAEQRSAEFHYRLPGTLTAAQHAAPAENDGEDQP